MHGTYGLLLIAGAHTHQENYARAFAADPRCRLIGLTDEADVPPRRRELNQQLAQELHVPLLPDLDQALAREDVDLVCLCPEPERRGRLTVRCASAGKHVYIDKPPATNVQEACQAVSAVAEAGVKSQMFSLVRAPIAQRAKAVLDSGRLGTLIGLHCELLFAKGIGGTADLSRPRTENSPAERFTFVDSKRELFCVGVYPLILFQWLTERTFESVYATTSNYFFAEHQSNDVEDFSCALMQMQDGLQATITVGRAGWSSHPSHGIHQVHLVGTDSVCTLDAYRPRLEIYSDAPPWSQPVAPHPEDPMGFWSSTQQAGGVVPKSDWWPIAPAIKSDAACFLDCIEQNCESDVPITRAAHALQIIQAAYVSAAERRIVSIANSRTSRF